jgi:hypothetical protein
MTEDSTIYGTLLKVEKHRLQLRVLASDVVKSMAVPEALEPQLKARLGEVVGLKFRAEILGPGFDRLGNYEVLELLTYRTPAENPFEVLRSAGMGKFFQDMTVDEFMKLMRGDDDDTDDSTQ